MRFKVYKWNKVYSSYPSAFIQRAAIMVSPAPGQYIMVYCFLGHADAATLSSHLHILSVPSCPPAAYKHADGKKIDGRRVLVDVERGRTVKGWRPRRLGQHTCSLFFLFLFFYTVIQAFIWRALNHIHRCLEELKTERPVLDIEFAGEIRVRASMWVVIPPGHSFPRLQLCVLKDILAALQKASSVLNSLGAELVNAVHIKLKELSGKRGSGLRPFLSPLYSTVLHSFPQQSKPSVSRDLATRRPVTQHICFVCVLASCPFPSQCRSGEAF